MELTEEQIAFIRMDIQSRGITMTELADSLVDHVCCAMEHHSDDDFQEVYHKVLDDFGDGPLHRIQQETMLLLILKREATMKKTMYVLGYIALMLTTTGLLFKIMHWPASGMLFALGFLSIITGLWVDAFRQNPASSYRFRM